MVEHKSFDQTDLNALRAGGIGTMVMNSPQCHFDSADDAAMYFAQDFVKAQSYDVEHPELTALSLFPQTSEADPGAETITFYSYDRTGMAKVVNDYAAHDYPRVDTNAKATTVPIKSLGASYGYSVQDMRASRLANKNLDVRRAEAARKAIDLKMNQIAWIGDKATGLLGVLSEEQQIPVLTAGKGATTGSYTWILKNADEILFDVNRMVREVSRLTKNVERPDTLVLPSDVFLDICNKRVGDTGETVLSFIKKNQPYLKNIVSAAELNANAVEFNPYAKADPETDGKGVALLFTNDPRKLSVEIPVPFYQGTVTVDGMLTKIPCEGRTAGISINGQ